MNTSRPYSQSQVSYEHKSNSQQLQRYQWYQALPFMGLWQFTQYSRK